MGEQLEFDGCEVFSATKAQDRDRMGKTITDWRQQHPQFEIVGREVRQSSDSEFHCLSITIFYKRERR
jgi:hypothetical protein